MMSPILTRLLFFVIYLFCYCISKKKWHIKYKIHFCHIVTRIAYKIVSLSLYTLYYSLSVKTWLIWAQFTLHSPVWSWDSRGPQVFWPNTPLQTPPCACPARLPRTWEGRAGRRLGLVREASRCPLQLHWSEPPCRRCHTSKGDQDNILYEHILRTNHSFQGINALLFSIYSYFKGAASLLTLAGARWGCLWGWGWWNSWLPMLWVAKE